MTNDKTETQRRVYVLPTELVDRIVEFQKDKGYPSEVEAVRKLLDEALLHRDTDKTIIDRFKSRLRQLRMPSEVAKDVLVGHPLVKEISFEREAIVFDVIGYGKYKINSAGEVLEWHYPTSQWLEEIPF